MTLSCTYHEVLEWQFAFVCNLMCSTVYPDSASCPCFGPAGSHLHRSVSWPPLPYLQRSAPTLAAAKQMDVCGGLLMIPWKQMEIA